MPSSTYTVENPQIIQTTIRMVTLTLLFLMMLLTPCHANNTKVFNEQARQDRIQKIIALQKKHSYLKQYRHHLTKQIHELKRSQPQTDNPACQLVATLPPEYDAYGIISKMFVVLSLVAGVIGPFIKIRNDFIAYRTGRTPIPRLEFGWTVLSLGGSLFFLGQMGFDQQDRGQEMGWDMAPSSTNAVIQLIVLTNLSIYLCRRIVNRAS